MPNQPATRAASEATEPTKPFSPGWLLRVTGAESDLDLEEATEAQVELAKVRTLFRTAFMNAPIGMAVVDESERILIANQALSQLTGYSSDELARLTIRDIIAPGDRELGASGPRHLLEGELDCFEAQARLRRSDGTSVWVALTVSRDGETAPASLIYQLQDISERRLLEGRLEHLVDHDFLTGLLNRRRFERELAGQIERQRRFGQGGAVLMMDLDGFKEVNDQFGHAVGDELLRSLAAAMRARSRATDVLARLSGDEFALLLPGAGRDEAEIVAGEILRLVRGHVAVVGTERAQVTASIGMTFFDGLSNVEAIALADAAMYTAKESGRDRFIAFESSDEHPSHSRGVGEASRLRRALRDGRFVLHGQPVWNLVERRVDAYELLIRMRGDNGELVAPSAFLYAAERFGLIGAIDCWVVAQAAELIAAQARLGRRVVLMVNLSGRSIGHVDDQIDRTLEESGIDPSCLVFELTETAAVGNVEAARAFSRRLHERGCRFALDDFGAGFASFYYLKNLPFDYIKIDGDFVRGLPRSPVDQLVISAIVTIARGMGKQTIAEFVSDQATTDLLVGAGVDYAQGFQIAHPRPIDDVLAESGA